MHTGAPPEAESGPARLEPVTRTNLLDYQIAKLKAFADSEEEPNRAAVEADMVTRRAELDADGSFLIARVGDEAVGIIGWYEGADRYIFNLATRAPFRNQGIARQLLSRVAAHTCALGKRSSLIATDPADTPVQFYRRMGFVDEIYLDGNVDSGRFFCSEAGGLPPTVICMTGAGATPSIRGGPGRSLHRL